jgi:hypothetical protein
VTRRVYQLGGDCRKLGIRVVADTSEDIECLLGADLLVQVFLEQGTVFDGGLAVQGTPGFGEFQEQ